MTFRPAVTAAIALSAALVLAGCSAGPDNNTVASHAPDSHNDAVVINDADVEFASMMIVHHEQAIEMSDIILAKDDADPQVRGLAEAIKAAQGPEIELMQSWLDDWGVSPDEHQMHDMDHGDGMMSEDDLAALDAAGGADASSLFLEQMIIHHEGAVVMAQTQIDHGSSPDAVELARTIIDAQTTEIAEMEELLAAR
ncbi:DUF305 domain-containing protein [Microbacterium amylolyticum]|uniref:Uncharacterized protein (DUF305 family) n=1 Tax=Microbacterium amylolyticum TaxID=936337 RepID=A0ABS4ZJZ3_9MICO|nr:DUF305 domain-containing protein [Microbacterium amylolyticum]MBP2437265.1 uncharacterized protein (DUF305 family) [Microbacterium amylolyticum]